MLWPQKVLEIQETIVGHGDGATKEELTKATQPVSVPIPVVAVGSERV